MENFECKAPMYVNFVQSSVLDESDDADKFFGKYKQMLKSYVAMCQSSVLF